MGGHRRLQQIAIATVLVTGGGTWLGAQASAPAPPAVAPAEVLDRAAQAVFLRTAKVLRSQTLSTGVTSPFRLTLSDGTVTHDASFQSVNERAHASQLRRARRGIQLRRLAPLQPGGL